MESLRATNSEFTIAPGDGAFYGPKIEYTLKDALGRHWQCGTIQVDFSMPERLGAEYVTESSERKHPVMLHRAILGSLERFIGILIEQHAGALPVWLSPVQAVVLNITDAQADYAHEVAAALTKAGIRTKLDTRNEKITYKIREHALQKVPYFIVLGDKEKDAGKVAVRARGNQDLGVMDLPALTELIQQAVAERR
jgi:threonyl-tRNA synthetase